MNAVKPQHHNIHVWGSAEFHCSVGPFDIWLDEVGPVLVWGVRHQDWSPYCRYAGVIQWHGDMEYAPPKQLEEAKTVAIALYKLNS